MRLRLIGYWRRVRVVPAKFRAPDDSAYPDPRRLVDHSWDPLLQRRVLGYLRRGALTLAYKGFSYCRFECGVDDEEVGSCELTDGLWVWPEGLAHYVEAHSVRLPPEFVEHAQWRQFEPLSSAGWDPHRRIELDLSYWLQWAHDQGAS